MRAAAQRADPAAEVQSIRLDVSSTWALHVPMNDRFTSGTALTLGFVLSNSTAPSEQTFSPCPAAGCLAGDLIQGTFNQSFDLNPALFQTTGPFSINAVGTLDPGIGSILGGAQGGELTWQGQPTLTYTLIDVPEPATITIFGAGLAALGVIRFRNFEGKMS